MKPASTQSDRNMNFDGIGEGPAKGSGKYAGNQWSGHSNDGRLVNKGRGPTRGNDGTQPITAGKPVTKDGFRRPPTDALPGSTKIKNPDYINGGAPVRQPSGTRSWDPKAGQNYSGNPDQIRVGQSGGPDYGRTTKGSRPTTAASQSDFNYGPGKQY